MERDRLQRVQVTRVTSTNERHKHDTYKGRGWSWGGPRNEIYIVSTKGLKPNIVSSSSISVSFIQLLLLYNFYNLHPLLLYSML